MGKYLDATGLSYLWEKIKEYVTGQTESLASATDLQAVKGMIDGSDHELADMDNAVIGVVRKVGDVWKLQTSYGVHRAAYIVVNLKDYDSITVKNIISLGSIGTTENPVYSVALFAGNISSNNVLYGISGHGSPTETYYSADYPDYDEVTLYACISYNNQSTTPTEKDEDVSVIASGGALLNRVENLEDELDDVQDGMDEVVHGITDHELADMDNAVIGVVRKVDDVWQLQTTYGVHRAAYIVVNLKDYDSITVKNIISLGSIGTTENPVYSVALFAGNISSNNVLYGTSGHGSPTETYYSADYPDYDEVTLYACISYNNQSTTPTEKDEDVSVVAERAGVISTTPAYKRIAICGDSLSGNTSALVIKQLNSILQGHGWDTVTARVQGGAGVVDNLTRAGGMGIRVNTDFTIPATGSVDIDLTSAWMKTDGTYCASPYASLSSARSVCIKGIDGELTIADKDIVGMAAYDSGQTFIKAYSANGETVTLPEDAAYIRYCYNNPQTGEAHVTVGTESRATSEATLAGYLDSSGAFVSDSNYLCTDFITVAAEATVYYDGLAVASGYTFTRTSDGDAVKVGAGTIFFDSALEEDRGYIHIWFTGQNGGYEDEEDWAKMVNSAARNFDEKFIVVSPHLSRTTDALVRAAVSTFGARYVNLREYCENSSIYDAIQLGLLEDTGLTKDDWDSTDTLMGDSVHENSKMAYLWAMLFWNRLVELGVADGEKVTDASYYAE